jgi:hypothetical protein
LPSALKLVVSFVAPAPLPLIFQMSPSWPKKILPCAPGKAARAGSPAPSNPAPNARSRLRSGSQYR